MAGLDGIAPMRRDTLGERIFAELSEFLISGRLHPGERLSLRKMAEQMGVSMMPVRDAVGRLANEGALVVSPNRAVLVPLMTRARLVEMTEVRLAVEGFAARRAASHGRPDNWTRSATWPSSSAPWCRRTRSIFPPRFMRT